MSFSRPTLSTKQIERITKRRISRKNKHESGTVKSKSREIRASEVLDPNQLIELELAFDEFDEDCDGVLSGTELGKLMRSLGQNPTEKELQDYVNKYDVTGDGKIELEDFYLLMYKKMNEVEITDYLREMFRVFDKNSEGEIAQDEIRYVLEYIMKNEEKYNLNDKEIDEIIESMDKDHDGSIGFEEFMCFMQPSIDSNT